MSRAFVRESDHADDDPVPVRTSLPPGVSNPITPAGAQRFEAELASLLEEKRRILKEHEGTTPAKIDAQKRKLEARIRFLQQILQSAVITHPPAGSRERVCFGAEILIRDKEGEQTIYQIVGIDETDLDRECISWRSPLARALLGHRAGERVHFDSPSGLKELEIISVTYR